MMNKSLIAIAILIGFCPMVYGQDDSAKIPVLDDAEVARIVKSLDYDWRVTYDKEGPGRQPISVVFYSHRKNASSEDIRRVCQLSSLESLWFKDRHLREMPPLENLPNLKHLYLGSYAPSDISGLGTGRFYRRSGR